MAPVPPSLGYANVLNLYTSIRFSVFHKSTANILYQQVNKRTFVFTYVKKERQRDCSQVNDESQIYNICLFLLHFKIKYE